MTERRWFLPMHTITAGNHDNDNIKITFNVLLEGDLLICRLRNPDIQQCRRRRRMGAPRFAHKV